MFPVQKVREFTGHRAAIYSLGPSLKQGHFISCGSEGYVAEWNIATGEGKALVEAPSAVFSMCLIPERNLLLLGLQSGDVVFVDLQAGTTLKRVQLHKQSIFDFLIMPDRQHVLVSAEDGAISLWNLDRMDHIHLQQVSHKSIRSIAMDPRRELLFLGSSDNVIRVFDLGLTQLHQWVAHKLSIFRLLIGEGGMLYSAGRDAHIKHWDTSNIQAEQLLQSVPAHNFAVNDLIVGPKGIVISGSMDKSIKFWDPMTLELKKVLNFEKQQCHWNGVNRLLWLENQLFSCSDDRKIMQWEIL